jgi:hypothetical protein
MKCMSVKRELLLHGRKLQVQTTEENILMSGDRSKSKTKDSYRNFVIHTGRWYGVWNWCGN